MPLQQNPRHELNFAAGRAAQEVAVSRERGIAVLPGYGQEAWRVS
jgi:hypothetical protein